MSDLSHMVKKGFMMKLLTAFGFWGMVLVVGYVYNLLTQATVVTLAQHVVSWLY